ncbi:outer membrane lipoprotein-sorting protein [bacterium]|nr:outer membrane lipoprotein-sorting protein [candidate division CSSED10-310 bacterium]
MISIAGLLIVVMGAGATGSASLTADEVAKAAYERYEGRDMIMELTMILRNDKGSEKRRQVRMWRLETAEGKRMRMLFTAPADLKGTGFVVYSYDDPGRDEDQWLYLPAIRRTRRIAGKARTGSFLGTDFSFDDLGDRRIEDDTYRLLPDEILDGQSCYVLEAAPKDPEYQYGKQLAWIGKDDYIIRKAEFFTRGGVKIKELTASEIKRANDIWTAHRMEMKDLEKGHSTVLEFSDVRYNTGLDATMVSKERLEEN